MSSQYDVFVSRDPDWIDGYLDGKKCRLNVPNADNYLILGANWLVEARTESIAEVIEEATGGAFLDVCSR